MGWEELVVMIKTLYVSVKWTTRDDEGACCIGHLDL